MQEKKNSEVLREAAGYIETNGWHQGYYVPDLGVFPIAEAVRAGAPCCALGAIRAAADGSGFEAERRAVQVLAVDHVGNIAIWNDRVGQTAEAVITKLREVADLEEAAGR